MEHNNNIYLDVDTFLKRAADELPAPSRERLARALEQLPTPSPLRHWVLVRILAPILSLVLVVGTVSAITGKLSQPIASMYDMFSNPDSTITALDQIEENLTQFDDDGEYASQDLAMLD